MRTIKEEPKSICDVVILEAGKIGFKAAFKLQERFNDKFYAEHYQLSQYDLTEYQRLKESRFERWMPLMQHKDAYMAKLTEMLHERTLKRRYL